VRCVCTRWWMSAFSRVRTVPSTCAQSDGMAPFQQQSQTSAFRALICHDGLCICTGHWVSDVQNPLHVAECRHATYWTTQAAGCHSELHEDDRISVTAAYHDLIVATVQWPFGACHMREAKHVPTYNRLPYVLFALVFLFNLCLKFFICIQCLAVLVWWPHAGSEAVSK